MKLSEELAIRYENGLEGNNNQEEVKNFILQAIIDGKSFTYIQDDMDGDVWTTYVEVQEYEHIQKLNR